MTEDFYCEEALSGHTPINKVHETETVLAFHHTRPFWPVHIVVIPKRHISSVLTLEPSGAVPAALPPVEVFPFAEQLIETAVHELHATPRGYALKMRLLPDAAPPATLQGIVVAQGSAAPWGGAGPMAEFSAPLREVAAIQLPDGARRLDGQPTRALAVAPPPLAGLGLGLVLLLAFAGGVLPGADGIKTGHTFEAGFNFLGAVERGGRRLVLVVAGVWSEPQRAAAAKALAEWGYAAWDSRPLGDAGMVVGQARVQQGDARRVPLALPRKFTLAVPKGTHPAVTTRIVYTGPLQAPIPKGAQVAGLEVQIAGQPVHYLPLVTTQAVGKAGPFDRLRDGLLGAFE